MPKFQTESFSEVRAAFVERKRFRRVRMIVDLTLNLISSDRTFSHREARSLVACAKKAILELDPDFGDRYDLIVHPHFERVLQERWPSEELRYSRGSELVN